MAYVEKECGMRVFIGAYIHSVSKENPLVIVPNGVIGVKDGKIIFIDVEDNLETLKEKYSFSSDNIYITGQAEFLMPGLIDTHIHAAQYPNAGLGLDLQLLEWLEKYTFPMEARFKDHHFARSCYKKVVERTLRNGTTTASYFATIDRVSSEILGDVVEQFGQRAFIGKISMDTFSPDFYIESTDEALKSAEEFVVNMLKKKSTRVQPILTPRFALTCSEKLMKGLAEIAKKYDVHVQTHLCETEAEIQRALELFPKFSTYTQIYSDFGLLSNKTILAHCVHMSESEIGVIKESSGGVSHCPTSNLCLTSGLAPVSNYLKEGVKVGLGTDVSGGYSTSILDAIRDAIKLSKVIRMRDGNYEQLSFKTAFFLGTLGGAQALNIDSDVGNFVVGKDFDALHVDLACSNSPVHLFPGETLSQMVEKFLMLGDDRNIHQVFVEGKKIHFLNNNGA